MTARKSRHPSITLKYLRVKLLRRSKASSKVRFPRIRLSTNISKLSQYVLLQKYVRGCF